MIDIQQITTGDILKLLPEMVPWEHRLLNGEQVHVLVCCAGFEDRSTTIVAEFGDVPVDSLIVVTYPTNAADNAALESFKRVQCSSARHNIRYETHGFGKAIQEALQPYREARDIRVVVDLSAMASYVICRVLGSLWDAVPNARLSVFYAEARKYFPTKAEWEQFYASVGDPKDNLSVAERYEETHFQSKGVESTYDCDVFPGKNVGPLGTLLVAIPNFSLQRMKAMLAYAESQYNVPRNGVRWFLGQPPDRVKNGWRYDALAALYNVHEQGVAVLTRDFRDVFQKLDLVWDELLAERHLVIAAMGSKMQHLGTFLFLQMHPECGLLHCEPGEFIAKRYTSESGPKWWIDFGLISELKQLLGSRGQLQFSW